MAVTITKQERNQLENINMSILDEIKNAAIELGFTLFNNNRPVYRHGKETKIISNFGFKGNSGLNEVVELFGQPIKMPKVNDHCFDVQVEITLDKKAKNKIQTHVSLNEHYDDGYLHEKLAKTLQQKYRYTNFNEVNGLGSELITINKTL